MHCPRGACHRPRECVCVLQPELDLRRNLMTYEDWLLFIVQAKLLDDVRAGRA